MTRAAVRVGAGLAMIVAAGLGLGGPVGAVGVPAAVDAPVPPPVALAAATGCRAPAVAVVVDFGHWGGSARRGCVTWSSSLTGVSALRGAGFGVSGTARYGDAFVCRIDNRPAPAAEPCVNTPSASSYWSYWHADAGQTAWSYSTLGASQHHPGRGSVDAWTFGATDGNGAGGRPSFSPADVLPAPPATPSPTPGPRPTRSHPASHPPRTSPAGSGSAHSSPAGSHRPPPAPPSTTAPTTAGPRPPVTRGAGAHPGRTSGRTRPVRTPTWSVHPSAVRSAATVSAATRSAPAPGGGSSTSPPARVVDATPARALAGAGSPWPTVAGLGLVAVLAAAGAGAVVRRRGAHR